MQPRLTIVTLNFDPEPTGTAPYTTYLAKHLAASGWNVTVIAGTPHYPRWETFEGYGRGRRRARVGGAEVIHLPHYVPRRPRLPHRVLMEAHFGLQAAFADWRDPEVVLLVSPALISTALALVAAKVRYRPARSAIWVQDLYTRGVQESRPSAARIVAPLRVLEKAVLSASDSAIVIHERFRRYVEKQLGVPASAVQEIRNWSHLGPVPGQDRRASRLRFGWKDNEFIALHAGNMGVKQNLENVVEAARYSDQQGSKLRFVLLGDGNQRQRLEALAKGVSSLQFIDPLPDDEYTMALSAADILLVNERPGLREMSVPSKLTSYFCSGRPVVGAVELDGVTAGEIKRSGAGVVVPSGEPRGLWEAVMSMVFDPEGASRLGGNGPRYAREHLSAEAAMAHWVEMLRSMLEK